MFWSYATMSPQIDTILCKEDFTLYELLDHENLLQELKGQNKKLIEFLLRPEVLEELVTLITTEPSPEINEKEQYKYANIACELLTCDLPALNERLTSENILNKFYNFLQAESSLNPLLSSYLSRIFIILISIKSGEQNWYSYQLTCLHALEYIKAKEQFVELLLRHFGTSAIMDLMLNLLTSIQGPDVKPSSRDWILSRNLIPSIISLLSPIVDPDRQNNASQVLCDVVYKLRLNQETEIDPILSLIESPSMIAFLLDTVLNVEQISETSLVAGVSVLLEILRPYSPMEPRSRRFLLNSVHSESNGDSLKTSPDVSPATENGDDDVAKLGGIIAGVLPFMSHFHSVLSNPPKKFPMKLTNGIIDPPFGKARLHIVRLLTVLIGINNTDINESLMQLNIMQLLLDLFFKYTWNNFLHAEVEKCIAFTVDTCQFFDQIPEDVLFSYLLNKCQLLQRILYALEENEKAQQSGESRRGYMGHLIRIASIIYMEEKNNNAVREMINTVVSEQSLEKWYNFTDSCLRFIIQLHSSPLGGIPQSLVSKCYEEERTSSSARPNNWFSAKEVNQMPFQESTEDFNISDADNENMATDEQIEPAEIFHSICAQKWQSVNKDLNNLEEDCWNSSHNNLSAWNSDDEDGDNEIPESDDVQNNNSDTDKDPWVKIGDATNPWVAEFSYESTPDSNWATFEENTSDSFFPGLNGESKSEDISPTSELSPSASDNISFGNQFGTIGEKSERKNGIVDNFSGNNATNNDKENKMESENCENICGSLFPASGNVLFTSEVTNGATFIHNEEIGVPLCNNNIVGAVCAMNCDEANDCDNSMLICNDNEDDEKILSAENNLVQERLVNEDADTMESDDGFNSKTDTSSLTSPEEEECFSDNQFNYGSIAEDVDNTCSTEKEGSKVGSDNSEINAANSYSDEVGPNIVNGDISHTEMQDDSSKDSCVIITDGEDGRNENKFAKHSESHGSEYEAGKMPT